MRRRLPAPRRARSAFAAAPRAAPHKQARAGSRPAPRRNTPSALPEDPMTPTTRALRLAELVALYIAAPLALALLAPLAAMPPALLGALLVALLLLSLTPGYSLADLAHGWGRIDWPWSAPSS